MERQPITLNDLDYVAAQLDTIAEHDMFMYVDQDARGIEEPDEDAVQAIRQARLQLLIAVERLGLPLHTDPDE